MRMRSSSRGGLLIIVCSVLHCVQPICSITLPAIAMSRWKVASVAVATGLAAWKHHLNGPSFAEDVSMDGKVVLITGGNTGLGKESAIKFAKLGAEVIIACRDDRRGTEAVEAIKQASKSSKVSYINLDLSSLSSVKRCADKVHKMIPRLDVLLNNAGVMALPRREVSVDGFEKQMAINHLGHFLFTNLLMDLLKKAPSPRIVNVSSSAHRYGKLDGKDIQLSEQDYTPWKAYGNSKLANILFTRELNRKLEEQAIVKKNQKKITVVAIHPGVVRTELTRYLNISFPLKVLLTLPVWYFTRSPVQGAQTQIFASASSKITPAVGGEYFQRCAVADTTPEAKDMEKAKFLWAESERLIGKQFVV